jgi:putative flippase GtrA
VLWLILHFTEIGPLVARLLSYLGAATTTWMLHRHLTFPAARRHRKVRQWLAFVVVNGAGALLNYGIYAALVLYIGFFGDHPVAAVAVGSGVAFVMNFWANKTWVFRASPS